MRKSFILYFLVTLFPTCGRASTNGGNLDDELIEKIRSDFQMDAHTRAMYNAITNTDIKNLAINRDLLREHNEFFSNKVKVKGISNQVESGRCWLFAALNSIRYHVIKKNKLKKFNFSHIYLTFWDKMEKANTFYEKMIEFRDRDMMDRDKGIMVENLYDYGSIFNVDLKMTKAQLALFRQNTPNHGMNLVGVDIQEDRPVKWLVENSWGSEKGSKGMWVMYDNWFDMNVYGIIVKKQYLPEDVINIFEQTPIKLPVWDPMWQMK